MSKPKNKKVRLKEIKGRVSALIEKNRTEVGSGKTIGEIEVNLLEELLNIGKLLVEDRLIEEEKKLEKSGYEIAEKKRKKREG